ncbi:MAG: DUF3127 domain-containing protein [Chitinophagaceae bacterium]|nr:DUF3127 domain-containing protein [Chitinophagaceae bacterium]
MGYELTGRLIAKYDIVQRSETFKTREFVVEKSEDINGRTITNYIKFQSVQDRTAIVDRVNLGDEIKVYFNIKGSKWEKDGKINYITNLDAWRIEQILQAGKEASSDDDHLEPLDTFSSNSSEAVDDLPF